MSGKLMACDVIMRLNAMASGPVVKLSISRPISTSRCSTEMSDELPNCVSAAADSDASGFRDRVERGRVKAAIQEQAGGDLDQPLVALDRGGLGRPAATRFRQFAP